MPHPLSSATSANPANPAPPVTAASTGGPTTAATTTAPPQATVASAQPGGAPAPAGGTPTQQFASLYAGDLAPDVTEAVLYEVFNGIGPVASIRVCRDSVTRKSLGYAYINFHSVADAERALDTLNYSPIKGRPCRLMWSHRDPALRRSGAGNVYVKNLDRNIDNKALYDTFSLFGNILSCKVALTPDGKSRGFGFVHFESDESAEAAIAKLNGMQIGEKTVYVAPFKKTAERNDGTPKNFTNVYIKHIPGSWTEDKIREEFGAFGEITSFAMQTDPKGRRFSFVNYAEFEQARAAVEEMDGKDVRNDEEKAADKAERDREREERKAAREAAKKEGEEGAEDDVESDDDEEPETYRLYVARAQSKAERAAVLKEQFTAARGAQGAGRFGGVNLYVKNLGEDVDDAELKRMFEPFGTITSVKVMTDEKGVSRGFGFVCFSTHEEATKAVTDMHLKLIGGKRLYVGMHEKREQRLERLQQRYRAPPHQMGGFNAPRGGGYGMAGGGGGGGMGPGGFGGGGGPGGFNQPQPMYYSGGGVPRGGPPMGGGGGFRGGMPGGPQYGGGPRGFGGQQGMMPGGGPRGPRGPPMGGMGVRGGPFGPMGVPGANRGPPGGMGGGGGMPRGPPMGMGIPNRGFPPQVQQQPPQQQPSGGGPAQPSQPAQQQQQPLTAAGLAAAPPAVQKQMLGEQLYTQIQRIQPQLAGKITGMMLEMDNSELLILLESESQGEVMVDPVPASTEEAAAPQPSQRKLLDSKFGVPVASDSDYVHDVSFSYYGDKVAMCTSAQNILIWKVSEDDDDWELEACIASAHNAPIWRLDWAYPEFGEIIASCSEDRVVSIWSCEEYDDDTEKQKGMRGQGSTNTRWRKRACLTDSSHAVTDIQFAPRRWGLKLASCSASGCVRTYEAIDPVNLATWVLEDVITVSRLRANALNTAAAVSPVPSSVIDGNAHNNEKTMLPVGATALSWCTSSIVQCERLVVVGHSGLVKLLDNQSGRQGSGRSEIAAAGGGGGGRWLEKSCVVGCKDSTGRMAAAKDVAWAPNLCRPFDILVVCGSSNLVCIFNCSVAGNLTHAQTLDLGPNAGPVWRVAWDLTGTILATAQEGGQVRIWHRERTREGKWIEDVKGRRSPASAAATKRSYLKTDVLLSQSRWRDAVGMGFGIPDVSACLHLDATKGLPPLRLEDRIGNPQSPYEIAKNIRQHISRLTKQDRNQVRRKKDFRRYTLHRMYEFAGLTHTTPTSREFEEEEAGIDQSQFVTGLTALQHGSHLPRSPTEDHRFRFPHTIHYKAWWGPPTVERNPNRYEGSMEGVTACFKATDVADRSHADTMAEVVGPKRYDKESGVIAVRADTFDNRNQNAAYLGDLVELLVRECGSASPRGDEGDTVASTTTVEAAAPPPLAAPIRRGGRGRRRRRGRLELGRA
ncbi:Protein phosphatase PP2A regulatory subunit B [Perkinsus olseni]|uniref:Protein phosphatase PP2A regulatory subunit B n=1 Tax=Perkinsus olseni TaxID=32597 RepID=A0A7J6TDD1_PEROL|nr:Protein phosphatase PP2A regulatory subunit B [Perkinsus olseni]